jgi:hypothetical protein
MNFFMGNPSDVKSLFPEFSLVGLVVSPEKINFENKNLFQNVRNWKKSIKNRKV